MPGRSQDGCVEKNHTGQQMPVKLFPEALPTQFLVIIFKCIHLGQAAPRCSTVLSCHDFEKKKKKKKTKAGMGVPDAPHPSG